MAGCLEVLVAVVLFTLVSAAQAQDKSDTTGIYSGIPGGFGPNTLPWNAYKLSLLKNAVDLGTPPSKSSTSNPSLLSQVTSFLTPTSPYNTAKPGATTSTGLLIYTPNNTALNPIDFGNFIQNAYANGSIKGVSLTAGSYTVNNSDPNAAFHLAVNCYGLRPGNQPFEISFSGSTWYFGALAKGGISLNYCNNMNFHGPFNFMYAASQLPFTQGTLKTITTNTATGVSMLTISIDTGYPTTTVIGDGQAHLCVAYSASGTLVPNATDIYTIGAPQSLGGQVYSFQANVANTVVAGQKIACRGNNGQHGFFTYNCANLTISTTYIYTAGIFGFLDSYGYNTTYLNNIIQPWPNNIGTTKPLLSTNADGLHVVTPLLGPTIVGNTLLSCGDDAMAVHGLYLVLATTNAQTNTLTVGTFSCNDPSCLGFAPGDTIYLYAQGNYTFIGSAVISTITYQPTDPVPGRGYSQNYPAFDFDTAQYFDIVLTSFPPGFATAPIESLIATPNKTGNQFKVANNYAGNNRARGLYLKASNGIIANNVVTGPSGFGLLMSPDPYFLEGDFVRNVIVTGNYISAIFGNVNMGSFDIFGNPLTAPNHQNVTFSGNTFVNGAYQGVTLTSVATLNFTGNAISTAGCYPYVNGLYYPFFVPGTLIYNAYVFTASIYSNGFQQQGCKYGNYVTPFTAGYTVDQYKFS